MQETFRALIVGDGRHAVVDRCRRRTQGYGLAAGGTDHPRARLRAHGQRIRRRRSLNANCQAHDCKNLFVADGSPFVSQADKNPTWTILALSWRTSEYIAKQRAAGAL